MGKSFPQRVIVPLLLALFVTSGDGRGAASELTGCVPTPKITGNRTAVEARQREVARLEKSGADDMLLAEALASLAAALRDLGDFDQAEAVLGRTIALRERHGRISDPQYVKLLEELAVRQRVSGKSDLAEAGYKKCMAAADRVLGPDSTQYGVCSDYLGVLYADYGRYAEAQEALTRAEKILERAAGPESVEFGFVLNDLGYLYRALGDRARAEAYFKRALAVRETVHGPCHENVAATEGLLGRFYRETGRPGLALPHDRRGLEIRLRTRGPEGYATAFSMNYLGLTLAELGRYKEGEAYVSRSLDIRKKHFGMDHRETLTSVWYLFEIRRRTGRLLETQSMIEEALRTSVIQRDAELRWRFQNAYRILLQEKGMASAAAYFGKLAVNTIQGMRAQLTHLERELQQSFVRDRTAVYRDVADLLIGQGRLAEAQQVLAMLKEEEYFDFIRRDGKDDARSTRSSLTAAEQPWAARAAELGGRIAALGKRRDELERKQRAGLTPEEAAEIKQVEADLDAVRQAFVAFMDEMVREMGQLDARRRADVELRRREIEGMERYQSDLKALGPGAVVLHYIVLPDKVRIILSTADGQTGYSSPIEEKLLNQNIQAFREALQYPREDPRPAGQALYQVLLAPVAGVLRQLEARVLILSLDGVLRYVPFAALHDGSRYLVEDYRIALVTEAAEVRQAAQAARAGRFAGLGLTHEVPGFDALPAVKEELEGILKAGHIQGEIHLDQDFTAASMKQALASGVAFLHVASHFVFKPGTETDSFLLLGDGSRLSLRDLRVAGYNFRGVDLLTLSACETAVGGGADANGREVEGLGVLAQQRGARAVMATLWPVADASTGVLMRHFYQLRASGARPSKAEALRQAQLALLTGRHEPPAEAPGARAKQRGAARADGRAPRYTPDPKAPYAHPYFWAPFILMGNWL